MGQFETNILFWNTTGNQVADHIVQIVGRNDVDVILLAESGYGLTPHDLVDALNSPLTSKQPQYQEVKGVAGKIQVFSRIKNSAWKLIKHRDRHDIWRIREQPDRDLYVAAAHFPEIKYEQGDGQRKAAIDLRMDIDELEQKMIKTTKDKTFAGLPLLVIGDLNASPFDAGIAGIYGLNATQRRAVAREGARVMNSISYPFMYNPMWQFLGASDDRAPGTYYLRVSGKPISYDWFLLDQVLLRPALLSAVKDSDVRIIEDTGTVSLVGNDRRPNMEISHHLPILVSIHR